MIRKLVLPLFILGSVILVIVGFSWYKFPEWANTPLGFLTLVIASLVGGTSFVSSLISYLKNYIELTKANREQYPPPPPPPQPRTDLTFTPLHQLRPPRKDFTGRVAELNDLRKRMTEKGVTITGLQGMGGIGKTELALVLAQELKDRYPDAQIYLDLRGAHEQDPLTPAEAMAHVVRSFHPEAQMPEDEAGLLAMYHSLFTNKRVLLLMDNARGKEQVLPLLPPEGSCLLVTSRFRFILPGIYLKDLDKMKAGDAETLLRRIAERLRGKTKLTAQLAKTCGYLPYALRVAASAIAETPNLTPEDYVERLQDESARVELIEASLKLSYDLLDEELKERWRALAVFPGGFDQGAAAAVWEMEPGPVQAVLGGLLRYSLLEWEEAASRYRLHDLARDCASRLLGKEEGEEYRLRHAQHYIQVLRVADRIYLKGGEGVLEGLEQYDQEAGNITAGQTWAAAHMEGKEEIARLVCDYPNVGAYIIEFRLHARERTRWLDAALTAARLLGDKKAEGHHLNNLGLAYTDLGETRKAIECNEQSLEIKREVGDQRGVGNSLGNLGLAYTNLGETRQAIEYYQEALEIAREIGDRRMEGQILGNVGSAYRVLGETSQAIEYCEQHLEIARETGDRRGEGSTLGNLGLAYAALGQTRQAIEYYEQDLEITREIGDRLGEGTTLGNLGIAYYKQGETRQAIEYYERQLEITRDIGYRRGEGNALGSLGVAYATLGENRRAIKLLEKVFEIMQETGDRRGEGTALWNLALVLDTLGKRERAVANATAALEIYEQIEDLDTEMVRVQLAKWQAEQ